MDNQGYRECTRCVMNNSADKYITFDNEGRCNYCNKAVSQIGKVYLPNDEGQKQLSTMIEKIKTDSRNDKYDCLMGLSGGLDSSYLAYLGKKWGLRVLAVHIDDGFDTTISKDNLRKLIEATGFEYRTIVPDAIQFNALTKAYMKAGVPNLAVPQDNVLFAYIYDLMRRNRIKYFLTGGNFALESILQNGNTYTAYDVVNIRDINRKFGTTRIDKLEFISTTKRYYDNIVLGLQTPRLLNYIDYNRERAFTELKEFCGFQYYGRKHLENTLTAFIQLYWFPRKFNVDKRTSHLSSMIVSGQMSREQALLELKEPIYEEKMMNNCISEIKNKLGISDEEFDVIMSAPTHQHDEYKTEDELILFRLAKQLYHVIKG